MGRGRGEGEEEEMEKKGVERVKEREWGRRIVGIWYGFSLGF